MANYNFIPIFKTLLRPFYIPMINAYNFLWDLRLNSVKSVRESGKEIFKVFDFGKKVRRRAFKFESKEPETLNWIKGFDAGDSLLDIGANIGMYSLYAAYKGVNVIAIEPDALNYALLNLNIKLNDYGEKIVPYCIAIHDENKFSKFNSSNYSWGALLILLTIL